LWLRETEVASSQDMACHHKPAKTNTVSGGGVKKASSTLKGIA
jgi:hypothetical protein